MHSFLKDESISRDYAASLGTASDLFPVNELNGFADNLQDRS